MESDPDKRWIRTWNVLLTTDKIFLQVAIQSKGSREHGVRGIAGHRIGLLQSLSKLKRSEPNVLVRIWNRNYGT